jgi:outer membrane receptor protein involved in Fe transport
MLSNREARVLALGMGLCAALTLPTLSVAQDTPAAPPAESPAPTGSPAASAPPAASADSASAEESPAAESPSESASEGEGGEGIASATGFPCAEMMDDSGNVRRIRRSGIVGLVRDAATQETIIEGAVQVVGGRRTFTNFDGCFQIELPPGTYALRVTYDLYQTARLTNVVVGRGEAVELTVELQPDTDTLAEVVVTARADRATEATQLELRRQSSSVSDGISAQEIARSPDSNAGDAARRVVGASVVGGQYLFVRGLGGRYTSVLLNGAQIPSTDPDVPGVQLDLFPASVLAAMTIYKTVVPDIPGDAAGGTLLLTTREFPSRFRLTTSLSLGYNSQTTFRDVLGSAGSGTDFLGFDGGTRALPGSVPGDRRLAVSSGGFTQAEVDERARGFAPRWALTRDTAIPNLKLGVGLGDSFSVGGGRLGYFLSLGYQREQQRLVESVNRVALSDGRPVPQDNRLSRETTQTSALVGALGAVTLEASDDDTIGLTILASQAGDDYAGFITGYSQDVDSDVFIRRLRWVERSLLFGQLLGDHQHFLGTDARLKWQLNGALGARSEPDTRDLTYQQQPRGASWLPGGGSGERLANALAQRDGGGSLDLTIPIAKATTRFGTFLRVGDRDFDMRRFRHLLAPGADRGLQALPPDLLFSRENIGAVTQLVEVTQTTDSYRATQSLGAAYGLVDWPVVDWLRFVGGVRVEGFRQTVAAQSPFAELSGGDAPVSRARTDVDPLPSASLVVQPMTDMFVRFAYGRAVARPQIRELAPFVYPDFVRRRNVAGNPDLQRATIDNFDLRWEWFPAPSEVIAVTGFYKSFAGAIESVIYDENGSTTFQNIQGARNLGIEAEARFSLGRVTDALKAFSIGGNVSFIDSTVQLSAAQRGQATSAERPTAGQSPYVANLSLGFAPTDAGLDIRLYYNVFGRRLVDVGRNGVPDVYQIPFHSLDLAVTWEIIEKLQLKASISNLLNDDFVLEQGGIVVQGYEQGVSASVGIGHEF